MDTVRILISHSQHDRSTAESLMNLIFRGLAGLNPNQVFCSSVGGFGLGGERINENLRRRVLSADVVLGLISPEAMASPWVLLELGARWGSSKDLILLLAPGVSAEEIRGPLAALNPLKCESDADLHKLVRQLAETLSLEENPPESYVGPLRDITSARVPMRPTSSIYKGLMHLDSTLFHEVEMEVKKLMGNGDGIIPTKYLFAHADSYRHYKRLVRQQAYTIGTAGNDLFANQSDKVVGYLLERVAPGQVLTVVSLGIGFGVKEVRLLKGLLGRGAQVSLLAIDQNPAFIQRALESIREECSGVRVAGARLSCKFMLGDFDRIDELSAWLPIGSPVIFLALGGTFGNQDEGFFLQRLTRACIGEVYLLMDFDRIPRDRSGKSGYASRVNKEFVSSMFEFFCKERPRRVMALSSDKLFDRPISRIGNADVADVIVMTGDFVDGRQRYFGYSTRYKKSAVVDFLCQQNWPRMKEFDDPEFSEVSLFLCKLETSRD